eukprot:g4263.t1
MSKSKSKVPLLFLFGAASLASVLIVSPLIYARIYDKDAGELQMAMENSKAFTLQFGGKKKKGNKTDETD